LLAEQRRALQRLLACPTTPPRQASCAQGLLLAAEGWSNVKIAAICRVSPKTVGVWRVRFGAVGTAMVARVQARQGGLADADHLSGRRLVLGALYTGAVERAAAGWSADHCAWPMRFDPRAHSHRDFLLFLKRLELVSPGEVDVHLVLDRFSSHRHYEVDVWLANPRRSRFRLYRTTGPATWTCLVEQWRRTGTGPDVVETTGVGQWVPA
jgi:hypothetical protein